MERDTKPLVSIICSVKNGSGTIEAVMDSIQRQTLHDWEMIVVDDGSTDDTVSIVNRYADGDRRVRLIATKGVGRGRALNIALSYARAEYVANIDADDPSHPMRLEVQHQMLSKDGTYGVVGTDTLLIFGDESPAWMDLTPEDVDALAIRDVTNLLTRLCPVNHSSVLMKRSAIIDVRGYDEMRKSQFDYDLWVRLGKAGHRIGRIGLSLAGKRIHPGQRFERSHRLRFLAGSAHVQWRAIRSLGGGLCAYFYLFARPIWGLLPNWVRMKVRQRM